MKKTLRIIGIVAILLILFSTIIISLNRETPISEKVWDKDMTIGNIDAKNYFIIYSDIACPYCIAFEDAIIEHEEDFEKYIAENDILVEIRLSDFLYEYGTSNPIASLYGAEAAYCAKNEGKFWDYYNLTISTLWNDYFKVLGKSAFSSLNRLDKDYWIDLGEKVGLGDSFANCVKNDESVTEVQKNAAKTAKLINGMPYFKFNSFISSGFDLSSDWDRVLMYFQAGLDS